MQHQAMLPWFLTARAQIRYMLGDAGRSYVVGYGKDPPLRAHHRGASCRPGDCSSVQQGSPDPNPNVISGALVGGAQAAAACHAKWSNLRLCHGHGHMSVRVTPCAVHQCHLQAL